MSTLWLIRHAQASFLDADYDVLSPLGEEQSAALGEHLAERGFVFDRVLVGPRRRHRQTADLVAAIYCERGLSWPEPTLFPAFDEHHGPALMDRLLTLPTDRGEGARDYFQAFKTTTERWVRGEIPTPADLEAWSAFRSRVGGGLREILSFDGHGQTIAAFTSSGPIAASVGQALDLDDERILSLLWRVRNAASSELVFSDGHLTLQAFNSVAHLREPRLVTFV